MAEQELHQKGKQHCSSFTHFVVNLYQDRLAILAVLEDQTLQVQLGEPKCEGDVVGCIETVPECTNHENEQLICSFVLERYPLVNALSEPFLHRYIPKVDLLSNVDSGLNHQWVHCVHSTEVLPVVAYSRCVDCAHA